MEQYGVTVGVTDRPHRRREAGPRAGVGDEPLVNRDHRLRRTLHFRHRRDVVTHEDRRHVREDGVRRVEHGDVPQPGRVAGRQPVRRRGGDLAAVPQVDHAADAALAEGRHVVAGQPAERTGAEDHAGTYPLPGGVDQATEITRVGRPHQTETAFHQHPRQSRQASTLGQVGRLPVELPSLVDPHRSWMI
jgi:hypothetical protein